MTEVPGEHDFIGAITPTLPNGTGKGANKTDLMLSKLRSNVPSIEI